MNECNSSNRKIKMKIIGHWIHIFVISSSLKCIFKKYNVNLRDDFKQHKTDNKIKQTNTVACTAYKVM